MRTTQQFSITLPSRIAKIVEKKVRSGKYASVSEVLREGVRALDAQDAAVERWLRQEVASRFDAVKRRKVRHVSGASVAKALQARHNARTGKKSV